jgi:DNA-binding response OmpR family regulator
VVRELRRIPIRLGVAHEQQCLHARHSTHIVRGLSFDRIPSYLLSVSRILVVEDEPAIAESVAYALGKASHQTTVATTLHMARQKLKAEAQSASAFDLILLDLMLPDGSGFDWISELEEQRQAGLALIVLSSRDSEGDRVRALEIGADDYITKPFSPREVVARVTAVLRRLSSRVPHSQPTMRLTVNAETRRAQVDGHTMDLTRVEFDLLALLQTKPGQVYARSTTLTLFGEKVLP